MKREPTKIKRLSSLVSISKKLKKEGKKIVLCHGVYDLIHPGHIRNFRAAKNYGDVLIVALTADRFVKKGPGRPIFNQELRAEVLSAIGVIDYIVVTRHQTAVAAIHAIRPDYFIKGPELSSSKETGLPPKRIEEGAAIKEVGGTLVLSEDKVRFSSSKLIGEYLNVYPKKTKKFLEKFKKIYSVEQVTTAIKTLEGLRVMVVGDSIIDQYHYCLPMGKSSKEPLMVHRFVSRESFAGGVLATANHLAALSKHVTLVTVLGGRQSQKNFIISKLRPAVKPVFFSNPLGITFVDRRFLDINSNQKLFQVSYKEKKFHLPKNVEHALLSYLDNQLEKTDLVVVNDFGHGMLTDKVISLLCKKAKLIALNVQANHANFGFHVITKYPKADFVCIDEQEIRLAIHDKYGELTGLIKRIAKRLKCRSIIVTKGPLGSISYSRDTGIYQTPALTDRVVDRVGAGDALFAITSPCVAGGLPLPLVSFLGNVAGALKLQIVGNKKQIEFADLVTFTTRLLA